MSRIAVIGSGNVATHLALGLHNAGHELVQITSKTRAHAQELAARVNATANTELAQVNCSVDFILIAVKDDAVAMVASQLPSTAAIVAHTSGSAGIGTVASHAHHGVFYPLQTFSKNTKMDLEKVPFFIEGNSAETQQLLVELAESISKSVQRITSQQLKQIHLAAVFACNFSNYMYSIAHDILKENKIDFNVLEPLIQQTVSKAMHGNPLQAQTGPAARNDQEIMNAQLQKLPANSNAAQIYALVSQSIIDSLKTHNG